MTFLCGKSGVYALGAVVANIMGHHQRRDFYLDLFLEVIAKIQFHLNFVVVLKIPVNQHGDLYLSLLIGRLRSKKYTGLDDGLSLEVRTSLSRVRTSLTHVKMLVLVHVLIPFIYTQISLAKDRTRFGICLVPFHI